MVAEGAEAEPILKPTVPEVLDAIGSLYVDQLKPTGRIILKRLRERVAAAEARSFGLDPDEVKPEMLPRIDPKHLRGICEACRHLRVEREEGKEYAALHIARPPRFVDVGSPEDLYPQELWAGAAAYFARLGDEEVLPCGRYACAMALMRRDLPFLACRSLGEVCHILQLAVSQKRLLGYREGQLVSFHLSEERDKEFCALQQQLLPSKGSEGTSLLPVASWEQVRLCLWQLLSVEMGLEPDTMTLANLKGHFQRYFELKLSETALGYARLVDLLQDPRLQDVCTLSRRGYGQIMIQRCIWWPAVDWTSTF